MRVAFNILHHMRDRLLTAHDMTGGPRGIEFRPDELLADLRQHVLVFRNCVERTQMRSCRHELRAFPLQRAGQLSSEADASAGRIGWSAPLSRALIGARVGDERIVRLPSGEKSYEVMAISYRG